MMTFHVLTIFPHIFDSYLNESILRRAQDGKHITVHIYNIRDFTDDKHRTVDDTPYGGGPGMVLKIDPIYKAVKKIKSGVRGKKKIRTILFSTRGKKFDTKTARRLVKYDHLVFISGRYEGVDERVAKYVADEEISIGDYILSGGELPSLVVLEATARFVPGVLGRYESLEDIKGSYPVYTKPEVFEISEKGKKKKLSVPKVLLSGDHKEIKKWREKYDV